MVIVAFYLNGYIFAICSLHVLQLIVNYNFQVVYGYLYKLVTQSTLDTCEKKSYKMYYKFATAIYLHKWLKQIK